MAAELESMPVGRRIGPADVVTKPASRVAGRGMHIEGGMASRRKSRDESDTRAFREAHRLLVAFGISAIPATLLLGLMGMDFLEGDFGVAGTAVMALAGCASVVCAVVSVVARRWWAAGKPLGQVLAVVCWPPLLMLGALFLSLLVFVAQFSFPLGGP